VGTGTGVLAIAAAMLAPTARVEACDTDPLAVSVAEENAQLNGVGDAHRRFRVGSVDDSTPSADLVCANLTADVILPLLPALMAATCGRLILSGILDTQAEQVWARLLELGAEDCEVTRDGEWVCDCLNAVGDADFKKRSEMTPLRNDRRRFYAPPGSFSGRASVVLSAEESRHLRDVLRLRAGEEAYVFDGEGREFACVGARGRRAQRLGESRSARARGAAEPGVAA
jgi:hypothetical protein